MIDSFQVVKAKDKMDLERFFPIMKELRRDLSFEDYVTIFTDAHEADGYEIVGIESENRILAVMGYRILHDFALESRMNEEKNSMSATTGNKGPSPTKEN